MEIPNLIAIDGPAASGKSTLAEKLADRLKYMFFDTGVMYRAVTWAALEHLNSVDNEAEVSALAKRVVIDVHPPSQSDGRKNDVLVDGEDVTWKIRTSEVEENVSLVASYKNVRYEMTEQQRRIGRRGKIVMVGRDIGTVVFPEADLKIYLDASPEERAQRRYDEIVNMGKQASYDEILSSMKKRDLVDSTRSIAPLKPAEDAVILNTDLLSLDEVLEKALGLVVSK